MSVKLEMWGSRITATRSMSPAVAPRPPAGRTAYGRSVATASSASIQIPSRYGSTPRTGRPVSAPIWVRAGSSSSRWPRNLLMTKPLRCD